MQFTHNGPCEKCRYWSELVAEYSEGQLRAMCLEPSSPHHGQMTTKAHNCAFWANAPYGAIDDPSLRDHDPYNLRSNHNPCGTVKCP